MLWRDIKHDYFMIIWDDVEHQLCIPWDVGCVKIISWMSKKVTRQLKVKFMLVRLIEKARTADGLLLMTVCFFFFITSTNKYIILRFTWKYIITFSNIDAKRLSTHFLIHSSPSLDSDQDHWSLIRKHTQNASREKTIIFLGEKHESYDIFIDLVLSYAVILTT